MPSAKEFQCRVLENTWVTPTVFRLRFVPKKTFWFEPGQFISVVVPAGEGTEVEVKRCYSFANAPEEAMQNGYELCVKYVPGGIGTQYLSSLKRGDIFTARAPFGHFQYRNPQSGRGVCFIGTGTGMAPLRSIALSDKFLENPPTWAICLQGVANSKEVLYRGVFEAVGVETVYCVSNPGSSEIGHPGRVTDFLRTLPKDWKWHSTDFYLCGNGAMINEINEILRGGYGVPQSHIIQESFSGPVTGSSRKLVLPKPQEERKIIPVGVAIKQAA